MTKAYIHVPPVPVEAGQKECPEKCPGADDVCGCAAFAVDWLDADKLLGHLRCSACHASERPEPEPPVHPSNMPTIMDLLETERDDARAEVQRLRVALRGIVQRCASKVSSDCSTAGHLACDVIADAREALEEER